MAFPVASDNVAELLAGRALLLIPRADAQRGLVRAASVFVAHMINRGRSDVEVLTDWSARALAAGFAATLRGFGAEPSVAAAAGDARAEVCVDGHFVVRYLEIDSQLAIRERAGQLIVAAGVAIARFDASIFAREGRYLLGVDLFGEASLIEHAGEEHLSVFVHGREGAQEEEGLEAGAAVRGAEDEG